MPISWVNSDGKVGVSEDAYMYTVEQSQQPKQEEQPKPIEQTPFQQAHSEMNLNQQEQDFYQRHLDNLNGPGGVDNTDGSRSSLYRLSIEHNDKTYNIPSVYGGKILPPKEAVDRAFDVEGIDKFPSYATREEADQRYQRMHDFMEKDTQKYQEQKTKPPTMRDQLSAFQQRLDSTSPAEANALQKFLGSLNIMPAPGKPQEEWTAKEHMGYMLNTAMSGMGGGFKAPTPMTRLFRAETSTLPGEKPAPMAAWKAEDPTVQGMLKATGRWFTNSKETAQWYQDKMGGKGISFLDVPTSEVQQHLASRNPEAARFTAAGRENEEYFLPSELASKRKPLSSITPEKTVSSPLQEQLAKYEELSSQGKTTKQIVKGTKMEPEMVRESLGRDNLAIAAFNSENALTDAYFKQLETLEPKLAEALKKQVSIKDLKRFTRLLPEERLKTIFEQLPDSVKQSFESGEQRRMNIDAGKKSKIIAKPLKLGNQEYEYYDFMEQMNKLSSKVDQKAFDAWLETAPESKNIEDRRRVNKPVMQKPLQKQYK